ncbi:MAG: peptidoglycan DD-metalloendopeptidase family protein [Longimicrobiales bacterium]|nr:peptidoglycan DD-metalloendopeptidase family protein [Longimicrobiales bacterium]
MSERPAVRILVIPEDGGDTRTFRLSRRRLRALVTLAVALVAAVAVLGGTWWYMAAQAFRVPELEAELAQFEETRGQVVTLARQLELLEEQYERIRDMFGIDTSRILPELWSPPSAGTRPSTVDPEGSLPTSWPLTAAGFVTQNLLEGGDGEHPGLDIAIGSHNYIRAAGAGTVSEAGEDPVYGKFVTVDHGEGYLTLYAHASEILVEMGRTVRRNEVIALTGNTGRSSAPHLHFEIRLNGETVDPLTLVSPPS